MKITTTSDNGPYETIFGAFHGYNVKLTTKKWYDGRVQPESVVPEERSCEIIGCDGGSVRVRLFVDDAEDTASGEEIEVSYDDIVEMEVY
jgi:hypothetical protein